MKNFGPKTRTEHPTYVDVADPRESYAVNDVVRLRIYARDNQNGSKTYGSDYFRVKLYTNTTQSSWACDVTNDVVNGTYFVYFVLRRAIAVARRRSGDRVVGSFERSGRRTGEDSGKAPSCIPGAVLPR